MKTDKANSEIKGEQFIKPWIHRKQVGAVLGSLQE